MTAMDDSQLQQYAALTERAGVVALPGRSLLEVTGADRVQFLHSFCTNDVKRLQPGQGCEAFFTSHQGKTVGHGLIFAHDDSLVVETTAGQAPLLAQHLDRFVISERVEFHDRSEAWSELFLGGEGAAALPLFAGAPLPTEPLSHRQMQIGGQAATVRRVGFTRSPGWLIQAECGVLPAIRDALLAAGVEEVGEAVFEVCRVEAGWPMFGVDITADNLPQEIDRNEQAISFKKGCYLGQETVARLDALGHVNRLLRAMKFSSTERPATGAKLSLGDKEVGWVTSAVWSPRFQSFVALGYVRRTAAGAGTKLFSGSSEVEVVNLQ